MSSDIAGARLRQLIERIERLEEEKRELAEDIKDVKAEAKSAGFDLKIIALVLKRRKMSREEAEETDALLEQYLQAIGDFGTTPLGAAASRMLDQADIEITMDGKSETFSKDPARRRNTGALAGTA